MVHEFRFKGVSYKARVDSGHGCKNCDLFKEDCYDIEDLECLDNDDIVYKEKGEEHAGQ